MHNKFIKQLNFIQLYWVENNKCIRMHKKQIIRNNMMTERSLNSLCRKLVIGF